MSETICRRKECGTLFTKRTHNMVFCSEECCRIETNAQIMRRYYKNKARKKGEARFCTCGTKLSRYNEKDICQGCQSSKDRVEKVDLLRKLGFINY